jgi:hypothetical protein
VPSLLISRVLWAQCIAALCFLLFPSSSLYAHPVPESRVWIDTTNDGVALTVLLPLNRLEFAYGEALAETPTKVLESHGKRLSLYLQQHVLIHNDAGLWSASEPQLNIIGNDSSAELEVKIVFKSPQNGNFRSFTMGFDAITHEVRTHNVQVFLRNDWSTGFVNSAPLLLGQLSHERTELAIHLDTPNNFASVCRLLVQGIEHIAQGADHLLFILLLLMAVPLSATGCQWNKSKYKSDTLKSICWTVTAFTAGHSFTLVLGSTGVVVPPSQPIEIAVAITIGVTAFHVWRPIFINADNAIAFIFGLIHGFAFSSGLNSAGLSTAQHAIALLSFNLGVEAMQLTALLVTLPALIYILKNWFFLFNIVRLTFVAFGFVSATTWTLERIANSPVNYFLIKNEHILYIIYTLPFAIWFLAYLTYKKNISK